MVEGILHTIGFFVSNLKIKVCMKVIELLRISTESLKLMSRHGIYLDDYRYIEAYEQFVRMRLFGVKYRSAITMLAEEYKVGERTLQRAFRRLEREC